MEMEPHHAAGSDPTSDYSKQAASQSVLTEAPNPKPTTAEERSSFPHGVDEDGGGGGDDRISNLPDAILCKIITLLPTKDGARTQILASPWRHLWRSAPPNLAYGYLSSSAPSGVASRILTVHEGSGRRHLVRATEPTLDAWRWSPAFNNVVELESYYVGDCQYRLPPPTLTFRYSATLRVATIGKCHLPDSTNQGLHFPQLKLLELERVSISECSLQSMVHGCPALECLFISRSFGFRSVRINSLSLKSIALRIGNHDWEELQFGELVIENAPRLERLLRLDPCTGLQVSVISAPKLETLGYLSDQYDLSSRLVFGSTIIQGLHIESMRGVVHTVKTLAIYMHNLSLDTVVDLMGCFPCLEKLYIQSGSGASGEKNLWCRKYRNDTRCSGIRLKIIVIQLYRGTLSHIKFATFFVQKARVLELMILSVELKENTNEFIAKHQKRLHLDSRASRGAQFHFMTQNYLHDVLDIQHVHDLDLTDPFIL